MFSNNFFETTKVYKTVEKKFWAKNFFGPPSQRKQGPEKKKPQKMTNFRPKMGKI